MYETINKMEGKEHSYETSKQNRTSPAYSSVYPRANRNTDQGSFLTTRPSLCNVVMGINNLLADARNSFTGCQMLICNRIMCQFDNLPDVALCCV
jgi:hypothetical protein